MTVCQSTQLETCALCQDTGDNNNDLNMMLHISPDEKNKNNKNNNNKEIKKKNSMK